MRFLIRQGLKLLIAAVFAVAPVLPAFAFGDHGEAGSAHILAKADGHADHAHHGPGDPVKTSPCDKHDGCQGQCCAVCTHCFTASVTFVLKTIPARSVQTPTVRKLHDSLFVTFLNRPPARG